MLHSNPFLKKLKNKIYFTKNYKNKSIISMRLDKKKTKTLNVYTGWEAFVAQWLTSYGVAQTQPQKILLPITNQILP